VLGGGVGAVCVWGFCLVICVGGSFVWVRGGGLWRWWGGLVGGGGCFVGGEGGGYGVVGGEVGSDWLFGLGGGGGVWGGGGGWGGGGLTKIFACDVGKQLESLFKR